jgi:hypothetical protein
MDNFKFNLSTKLIFAHILLSAFCLLLIVIFQPPGEYAYLSIFGILAITILALPWSILSTVSIFALNDTGNPFFLFLLFAMAAANSCLIYLISSKSSKTLKLKSDYEKKVP